MSTKLFFPSINGSPRGTFSSWIAEDGAPVTTGDLLYYAESGDCILEIQSTATGQLRTIGISGATYQTGDLIGTID
jgi:Biotin-requiring enzyme